MTPAIISTVVRHLFLVSLLLVWLGYRSQGKKATENRRSKGEQWSEEKPHSRQIGCGSPAFTCDTQPNEWARSKAIFWLKKEIEKCLFLAYKYVNKQKTSINRKTPTTGGSDRIWRPFIEMFLVTSPIVINVPTRGPLAGETMHAIVQWLENLIIKRNMTSMFVNKKHRYISQ